MSREDFWRDVFAPAAVAIMDATLGMTISQAVAELMTRPEGKAMYADYQSLAAVENVTNKAAEPADPKWGAFAKAAAAHAGVRSLDDLTATKRADVVAKFLGTDQGRAAYADYVA